MMDISDSSADKRSGCPNLVIREAVATDAHVLLRLIDELADYEKLDPPTPEARERLTRDGFGPTPLFRAVLAEAEGTPLGYAIVFPAYSSFLGLPTLFIEDIFVRSNVRGQGIGKALFRHLARIAVEGGYGRMEWMVLDWNRLAIDFYDRSGATRLSEWLPYRLTRGQMIRMLGAEGAS